MILEPPLSPKEDLIRWVDAKDFVADNLLPGFYEAEFLDLDRNLHSQEGDYVELGDLVRPVSVRVRNTRDPVRFAIVRMGRIDIRDGFSSTVDAWLLPREAILVGRGPVAAREAVPVAIWREDIWGGKGSASSEIVALESLAAESVAWLGKELREPYCQKQIRRLLCGLSFSGVIVISDLLRVRVRQLPLEDQRYASKLAVHELRESQKQEKLSILNTASDVAAVAVLSGVTFEERRQQFEEYLRQETNATPLAFVEASTSNSNSDLFTARPMTGVAVGERFRFRLLGTPNPGSEQKWRSWYWDGTQNAYMIYHSLADDAGPWLPEYLFVRLAPSLLATSSLTEPSLSFMKRWAQVSSGQMLLPKPAQMSVLLQVAMESDSELTREMESGFQQFVDLAGLDSQQQFEVLHDAYNLLRQLFRPILALRVMREGRTAGVYFLAGNDQIEDPVKTKVSLEELGEHLLRILRPPGDLFEASIRRESIRRLSWFAHQINGPIGRVDAALRDIEECLEKNPAVASLLVPDESTARRMAAMANQPVESYQIRSRLETAVNAIHDLRRVNYQIRQLRRVQGDLAFASCRLLPIIRGEIQRARESLPNLLVREIPLVDDEIEADAQLLTEVFQEIFNNSIRELKTRKAEEPAIEVTVSRTRSRIQIALRDNGLPALVDLIDRPFEEDSSTYASLGKGSGLGLTVVQEIVFRHGGTCSLAANRDTDGERVPGVTFKCELLLEQNRLASPHHDER